VRKKSRLYLLTRRVVGGLIDKASRTPHSLRATRYPWSPLVSADLRIPAYRVLSTEPAGNYVRRSVDTPIRG